MPNSLSLRLFFVCLTSTRLLTACDNSNTSAKPRKANQSSSDSDKSKPSKSDTQPPETPTTLTRARKAFKTNLTKSKPSDHPLKLPPKTGPGSEFIVVHYDAPGGVKYPAYLTKPKPNSTKQSAIIWITGGHSGTIGEIWKLRKPGNAQSAVQYRNKGIVMMFPSMRGGNSNPGKHEACLGEVDDVIAAREFLAKQPHVNPNRIYLGGHSTGGTMALLIAASTHKFRAVFSFGPTSNIAQYGADFLPVDINNQQEIKLRSPIFWLDQIKTRTLVIEGEDGNSDALAQLDQSIFSLNISFTRIRDADHFDVLAPINDFLADPILKDTGPNATSTPPPLNSTKPSKKVDIISPTSSCVNFSTFKRQV